MDDAGTFNVDLRSKDGKHYITIRPTKAPAADGYQSLAACTCGWGTVQLFGHMAQGYAQRHLKAVEPAPVPKPESA